MYYHKDVTAFDSFLDNCDVMLEAVSQGYYNVWKRADPSISRDRAMTLRAVSCGLPLEWVDEAFGQFIFCLKSSKKIYINPSLLHLRGIILKN